MIDPKGSVGVYDVHDKDGKLAKQVTLLGMGDPFRDNYYFAANRLYIATGFADALVTMAGSNEASEEFTSAEPQPMIVVCYEIGADIR